MTTASSFLVSFMFYPQYGPPLQQKTHQNSNYLEIFNRRREVAAEPSNRHEKKESSFRPGFTLVDSWCLDEEVILTRPGHAWVISSKSRAPLYHTWGPKSRQREEIGDMWRGPADKECHVWNGKSEICRSWDLENFKCGGRRISRGWLRWHSEFTDMIVRW